MAGVKSFSCLDRLKPIAYESPDLRVKGETCMNTMKSSLTLVAVLLGLILIGRVEQALAQANFYEGKTVRFIVGFSAGGGYDTYTRVIARHMWKHVPGNPVFVVD